MSTVLDAPPAHSTITPDELLQMVNGDHFELVDGQLVQRNMGALSGWVGGEMFAQIREYARQHGGWAFGDGVGYQCYSDNPEKVRKPDASFIKPGRLNSLPDGYLTAVPDLVVEVVSPNDVYCDVESKIDEYLNAGVELVWVVNPANRSIRVFQSVRVVHEITSSGTLDGADVMPGFVCEVRSLFPAEQVATP